MNIWSNEAQVQLIKKSNMILELVDYVRAIKAIYLRGQCISVQKTVHMRD